MSEHALIAPEGDVERRRHAHVDCLVAARRAGELPTYDEWRKQQPGRRGKRLGLELRGLFGHEHDDEPAD
jgi:hypothetical protein